MMRVFPQRYLSAFIRLIVLCLSTFVCTSAAFAQAQSNAADLQGYVRDAQGAVVVGAAVTARNPATNFSRDAVTNDDGYYQILNLPPGEYEVTVEAKTYKKAVVPSYKLTVGARADLDVTLQVGELTEVVNITTEDQPIVETTRTTVANTIEQQRIENLPINQRDYLGFSTTISTVNRGNDRPIGPAPSSGLNIGGQRGRSTLVQVDGADNTDNSVNAARSTVSQEAVQEFQVATNSYAPEFGRATGGIINVVTKGGTNDFRGNVFGFIRHKSIQARNAFAPIIDNDPNKKPPFTRAQYGATLGGPIVRNRTFFFTAFEQRRRQESGFFTSDVAGTLNGSATIPVIPGLNPIARTFNNITPAQATFINSLLTAGGAANVCLARTYAYFVSSGGSTALNGINPLTSPNDGSLCPAFTTITGPTTPIGGRFLLSGTPVPTAANNNILPNFITVNSNGDPIGFRPLNQLKRIFPISEATTFFSLRGDHRINKNNQLTMRFGYNPSDITGIQDESQNQTLGQNDFSRTGIQTLRDTTFTANLTSTLSNTIVNEARFQFGRRKATFDSQVPSVALQITGAAFIGANPFSPVNRREDRFQFADNLNWVIGNHTTKFGADFNFINIDATFELNFPGLFNFGTFGLQPIIGGPPTCISLNPPTPTGCQPPLTPTQSYGLGIPSVFIQGFGNPASSIKNRPLAFFAQDSWKVRRNLTLNYGVRYDVELTDTIAPVAFRDPLTGISLSTSDLQAAQDVLNVQQGYPRDKNNFAPRFGLAWDINSDGKTVLRAAYGIFYDHPQLASAFISDIADGSQQQQYTNVLPISPAPNATLNLLNIFQGTVCTAATTNPLCPAGVTTPGAAASAQYLPGRLIFNDQTFVGFGPVFPFSLPVSKDYEYAYANQANITIERQVGKNLSFSASWIFVGAHHLSHPQDVNSPQVDLLAENFRRFAGRAPTSFSEAVLFFNNPLISNPAFFDQRIPGLVWVNRATGAVIVNPLAANFFRPNGPNYFFVVSASGGLVTPAAFNAALVGSVRTPGGITPFGDVSAQLSNANSNYNAMNLELKRRFSNNFQFLASYTWSHSIDESSDLQTLLKPQNNRNLRADRSDSLFDQRHRFVFSAVVASPTAWRTAEGFGRRFLSDFTIAPILEISSGRPFNIITGTDNNADLQGSTDRPSVASDGTLFIPQFLADGSLGRNRGITHSYASLDLRVARAIRFGERFRLDVIAEGFNLFNRFNEGAANPNFDVVNAFGQRGPGGRYYSRPTAAFDPRQFQFGLKINF